MVFVFFAAYLGSLVFFVGIDVIFLFLLDVSGSRLCRLCRVVMPSTHFFIDPPSVTFRLITLQSRGVSPPPFEDGWRERQEAKTTLTLFCELVTSS